VRARRLFLIIALALENPLSIALSLYPRLIKWWRKLLVCSWWFPNGLAEWDTLKTLFRMGVWWVFRTCQRYLSDYKIHTRSVENQNNLPWYYHHGQGGQHDNWFILYIHRQTSKPFTQ
jgi:hypothetical protein